MAYRKYNSGRKYNRNNNRYYNDKERKPYRSDFKTVERPQSNVFDASAYKKENIIIKDLNGREFVINGNFTGAYAIELSRYIDKITEFEKVGASVEKMPEMFDLLKQMTLTLINMNVEGAVYDMKDVEQGFNDINVLFNLMNYIVGIINASGGIDLQ